MLRRFKTASVFFYLCVSAILPSHTIANLEVQASPSLEPATIRYEVGLQSSKLGNAKLGELETKLEITDGIATAKSVTKAQGLAAVLLGAGRVEECKFKIDHDLITVESYTGGTKEEKTYQVDFDWDSKKIRFSNQESLDILDGYTVDNCSFPFAATLSQGRGLEGKVIYVVDGLKSRVRGYLFESVGQENVTIPMGSFSTVKLVLRRELRPERSFTFWLSPEHGYLPIKMQEKRKSRTTTMSATRVER